MGLTALVTGAGGPAGVSVIRALRGAGTRVVAADADAGAVGLDLADEAGVLPLGADPTFVDRLEELALERGATVLVLTTVEEMPGVVAQADRLAEAGLAFWLPDLDVVDTCVDKWAFAQALARLPVAAPATGLASADGVPGPWIVKPRKGRGSRDVFAVDDPDELPVFLRRVANPIVQTRVPGREFTVDALVARDGTLAGAVLRWREETRAGISTRGTTFEDDVVVAGVRTILEGLGLTGPANVQGFVDADGQAWFIEVNPRFSGGLPLSLAAGADLVGEYVRGALGHPVRPERLVYRPGVSMRRYFEEVITT